jgi:mono/diheme cytochrome c family protein
MRLGAALAIAWLLTTAAAAAAAAPPPERSEEDFVLHCSGCHRLDGFGTPGVTPSLHGLGRLLVTSEGRDYLGRVPGVAQAPLADDRLAALLNWVILAFSGSAPAPPYTAAEVGDLRRAPLRDPAAARAGLGARLR